MNEISQPFILRGQTLSFRDDPFLASPEDAIAFDSDGAIVITNGSITDTGTSGDILAKYPELPVDHYPQNLILAGFVDCHVHYPQVEVMAAYGEQLLDWLDRYTFPAEAKFANEAYARKISGLFLDQCLRNGTTTASIYATVHPQSVDAFFAAAQARNMCMASGKMLMDRNAPDYLLDKAQSGYDQSKALIEKWHRKGRLTYAITPRFAVTSTPEQLEAAGTLWREYPTALMQTHLSENHNEIALVRSQFPDCTDYFGAYEKFGLAGEGANFGHAIHLSERERSAFRDTRSGISHCPTSNLFLGSGLMDMQGLREGTAEIPVGLASDIGGGWSLSMFHTMKASYEVCRLNGYNLHPAKAFYLATLGSAHVMRLGHRIGNIAKGYDADIIVVDLHSTPAIANRMHYAKDLAETLFIQMIMADDRAIRATYIAGKKSFSHSANQIENELL